MKAKEHEKVHGIGETAYYIEETGIIRIFKSPPRYYMKNGLNPTNNGFKPFFYAFTLVKSGEKHSDMTENMQKRRIKRTQISTG